MCKYWEVICLLLQKKLFICEYRFCYFKMGVFNGMYMYFNIMNLYDIFRILKKG